MHSRDETDVSPHRARRRRARPGRLSRV